MHTGTLHSGVLVPKKAGQSVYPKGVDCCTAPDLPGPARPPSATHVDALSTGACSESEWDKSRAGAVQLMPLACLGGGCCTVTAAPVPAEKIASLTGLAGWLQLVAGSNLNQSTSTGNLQIKGVKGSLLMCPTVYPVCSNSHLIALGAYPSRLKRGKCLQGGQNVPIEMYADSCSPVMCSNVYPSLAAWAHMLIHALNRSAQRVRWVRMPT